MDQRSSDREPWEMVDNDDDMPEGENRKRPGEELEREDEALRVADAIFEIKDSRGPRHGELGLEMLWDVMVEGSILNITGGLQDRDEKESKYINKSLANIKEHNNMIVGTMKLQQDKASYFVHRDMETSRIMKDPWVEKQISQGKYRL